ncbi:MAG: anti-sigma F factor antagonist [Clostridiales bacterium]|jgi:stage II sporulation protein AA (anti-sigma F factor antagonist)|nr:anti-sigma F factor antagonist [Clostridiales bacterium]
MLNLYRKGAMLVVRLEGELDHHSVADIRVEIDEALEENLPEILIFDLANVSFMDSSGIGMIIGRYRQMQEQGGRVGFVGINQKIDKLMQVSGLLKIIPIIEGSEADESNKPSQTGNA